MCKHAPRLKLLKKWDLELITLMRHLKTDEEGGDPVPVVLNGSTGGLLLFFFAATRRLWRAEGDCALDVSEPHNKATEAQMAASRSR